MANSPLVQKKTEQALDGLRKLPGNRWCIDCCGTGSNTTLANLSFGTFICTECSVAHRELNHRCKGLSASVFQPAEVSFLQSHGNDAVRAVWHARLAATGAQLPNVNDAEGIRAFVRAVYVDKKFYTEPADGSGGVMDAQWPCLQLAPRASQSGASPSDLSSAFASFAFAGPDSSSGGAAFIPSKFTPSAAAADPFAAADDPFAATTPAAAGDPAAAPDDDWDPFAEGVATGLAPIAGGVRVAGSRMHRLVQAAEAEDRK